MKYFLDTEFIESGPLFPLILLSVGLVSEDGRELYLVNEEAPLELANDWVKANVIPHLGEPKALVGDIARLFANLSDWKRQNSGATTRITIGLSFASYSGR